MDGVKTVALVGLGGYGHIYVNALLDPRSASRVSFVAGVDPAFEACTRLAELNEKRIPIFRSLEEFCAAGRADLVILSTPLQLHCEQACFAMAQGSHVLCEKPLGAHPDQARQMIEVRDRSGLQLAIGYQWSFSAAIQNLKRDISAGRYGRPKRLRTRVYWPRDEKYYGRSSWAGRQRDQAGRPVFDSPANNACAHHLHNMFYVLGETPQRSDWPSMVQAELYRATPSKITTRLPCGPGPNMAPRFSSSPLTPPKFNAIPPSFTNLKTHRCISAANSATTSSPSEPTGRESITAHQLPPNPPKNFSTFLNPSGLRPPWYAGPKPPAPDRLHICRPAIHAHYRRFPAQPGSG